VTLRSPLTRWPLGGARVAWLLTVLLWVVAQSTARAEDVWARGPLVDLPDGWECGAVPAIHYWQGDCWDKVSGAVVRFGVSDIDWGGDVCASEPGLESTEGFSFGTRFCAEEVLDARSWWIEKFAREMPELQLDDNDDNIPPAGTSEFNIYFVSHGSVWGFHSQFCTPAQRSRALSLIVAKARIDFEAKPDLLKHVFGDAA
jgi:hypothetical protein